MPQRSKSKFNGVYTQESIERRHNGKPDISYIIDYYQQGKRVRKAVGWASEGMSAALARDIRNELIASSKGIRKAAEGLGQIQNKLRCLTLNDAFSLYYQDWLLPQKASHESDLSMFNKHLRHGLGKKALDAISPHDIDILVNSLRAAGLAHHTANYCAALIRQTMNKMIMWGKWRGSSPFQQVHLEKPNNARERFLSMTEVEKLLTALQRRSPQMHSMAIISMQCGMRFGEIAALRWCDINLEARTIFIADPKNNRSRHAVMSSAVFSLMQTFAGLSADALLFPARGGGIMKSPSCAFSRTVADLGLNEGITDRRQKFVFHSLRHSYASWLALSGESMMMIADRLGHSSIEMSKRYTHLMPETRARTAAEIDDLFKDITVP